MRIIDKNGVEITEDSMLKGPRGRVWEIDHIDDKAGLVWLYDELPSCVPRPRCVNAERMVNYEVVGSAKEMLYKEQYKNPEWLRIYHPELLNGGSE